MIKIVQTVTIPLTFIILLVGFPQISETIYSPSLPDIAQAFQADDRLVEFTLSIYFLGFALGVLCWGIMADFLGRRPAMIYGLLGYVAGSLGCYYSSTIEQLLFWRFIQAFGASSGSIVTQTMLRDLFHGAKRGQVFSSISGALSLSPALGPLIGGMVDQLMGWHGNFFVLVAMGMSLFIYAYLYLPETKQPYSPNQINLSFLTKLYQCMLKDRNIWRNALLVGACNGIIFSFYAEAPFIFIELLDYTPSQYGILGLLIAASGLVASFVSHRLNKTRSPLFIIRTGCILISFASLFLVGLVWGDFIKVEMTILTMGCALILLSSIFLGIGLIVPNTLSQALNAYSDCLGMAGAFFGLIYYLLIAAFTFLMGVLHNGSFLPMPAYFLAIALLMIKESFQRRTSPISCNLK